jgi:hypothetical protein
VVKVEIVHFSEKMALQTSLHGAKAQIIIIIIIVLTIVKTPIQHKLRTAFDVLNTPGFQFHYGH